MKLLNKSRISIFPDDVYIEDVYNGIIVESSDINVDLSHDRVMVYEAIDTTVTSYYKLNEGQVLLSDDSVVYEIKHNINDIEIVETVISELKTNSFLADSTIINNFKNKKELMIEVGLTSEDVETYKIINGLGDDFTGLLPVHIWAVEKVNEEQPAKEIIFEHPSIDITNVGAVFIDDIAVKVN